MGGEAVLNSEGQLVREDGGNPEITYKLKRLLNKPDLRGSGKFPVTWLVDQEKIFGKFGGVDNIFEVKQRKLSIPRHLVHNRLMRGENVPENLPGRTNSSSISSPLYNFFSQSDRLMQIVEEKPNMAYRTGWRIG